MAITGTGKIKRNDVMHFVNVGTSETPIWEQLGDGIESLLRELNNKVETKQDITGKTSTTVTKGNQVSSFNPFKAKKESKLFAKLYKIYTDDLELSDVEMEFLEVSVFDEVSAGVYSAIKQTGAVDLKSYGGDTTGLDLPFEVNYIGDKIKGNFTASTKAFAISTGV
jgi:hypothetical protein